MFVLTHPRFLLGTFIVVFASYLAVSYGADWFSLNGQGYKILFLRMAGATTTALLTLASIVLFNMADSRARWVFGTWLVWLSIFLAMVWPGLLMSDTYSAFLYGLSFPIDAWLGFMTPVFYQFVLQVIPKYWALAGLQVIMAAATMAYADWTIRKLGACNLVRLALHLPLALSVAFVSTTLLLSRDVPFAFVNVALALVVFNYVRSREWLLMPYLIAIPLLSSCLLIIRTDGLAPASAAMTVIGVVAFRNCKKQLLIGSFFLAPLLSCSLLLPAVLGKSQNDWGYRISLALNPLGQLVQGNYYESQPGSLRSAIEPIVSYEHVVESSIPQEVPLYWDQSINNQATEQQKSAFLHAVVRLVRENPAKFIAAKITTAGYASGLGPRTLTFVEDDLAGRWAGLTATNPHYRPGLPMSQARSLWSPIGPTREQVMHWLYSTAQYHGLSLRGTFLWWNFVPELCLLLAVVLAYRWAPASSIAALVVLMRVPTTVLLAPASHFKYYFPVEIAGSLLLIAALLEVHRNLPRGLFCARREKIRLSTLTARAMQ